MRSLLVVVACGACAKVDDLTFPDPLITVVQNSAGVQVVAPDYKMTFRAGSADMPDLHMPESLLVKGVETFGRRGGCNLENNAGIAMFPALTTNANPKPAGLDILDGSEISVFLPGPYIAAIDVKYHLGFQCNGAQELQGEAIFSFFPNGRIVRQDLMVSPLNALSMPDQCICDGGTGINNFAFTSFWSFAPGASFDPQGQPVATPQANNLDNGACTTYADRSLGVKFSDSTSRLRTDATATSHIYDFTPQNANTVPKRPETIFSAVQLLTIGNADCATILGGLAEPALEVNGNEVIGQAGSDGIYDLGDRQDAFSFTTVDMAAPPNFTVVASSNTGDFRVTRDPAPTNGQPVALIQRTSPGESRFFFVFTEGLAPGAKITIEPL